MKISPQTARNDPAAISAESPRPDRSARISLLLLPVIAAAILRFYALDRRGLAYWDEAKFALEGVRLQAELAALIGHHASVALGKAVGTAKPTHALLIALAYAILGVHDDAPLCLGAAAGVAEVVLLYFIGRRLFSPLVGLVAALLLSVAPYDIVYARSGLSESDGNVFLLAGVLLWLFCWERTASGGHPGKSNPRWVPISSGAGILLGAGLLLGLAFTTNYRLVVYIAVIVVFDLVCAVYAGGPRKAWRAATWALGLGVVPALWQAIDVIAADRGTVLFRDEQTTRPERYVDQVMHMLHAAGYSSPALNPLTVQWYVGRQGWLMAALLLGGLATVLWRRSFPWLAPAALVVIPFVAAMSAPYVVARSFDAGIPFASLLIAAALLGLATWRSWTRLVIALVILVAAVLGIATSWQLTAERSGFARVAAYLHQNAADRTLTSGEVMVFYLRGSGSTCNAPRVPYSMSRLAADIQAGYRYAVLDYHLQGFMNRIVRHHAQRVAQYQTLGSSALADDLIESEDANRPPDPIAARYVEVYRLDGLHLSVSAGVRPDTCIRDATR